MTAVVTSIVTLPLREVNVRSIRKELTLKCYKLGEDESYSVPLFSKGNDTITVPRKYGLAYANRHGLLIRDDTSSGGFLPKLPAITLRPYQEPWVDNIVHKFSVEGLYDIRAMAATGKGKTVMSLEIARRLGLRCLIIVDQEFLMKQWLSSIEKFFDIDSTEVGILQGGTCTYKDKPFTIGMVQTLHSRRYPEEVYESFGTLVLDESHTIGAEKFSKVLGLFNARYRLAPSATPDRKDCFQKLLQLNLGDVEVELSDKHRQSIVRYVEYKGAISWYSNISPKTGRYLTEISTDSSRNVLIAHIVKYLYDTGREVLGISDRISQLEDVRAICIMLGVPEEDLGIIAGYSSRWSYIKDPTPSGKPPFLCKGCTYTPIKLALVQKRTPKKVLEELKNTRKVLLATYGMFSKGVDLPRLSSGVDMTPRSASSQVHGRILRDSEGKLTPIWVTLLDTMSFRACHQFINRVKDYLKSNARVYLWKRELGVKEQKAEILISRLRERVEILKEAKILTVSGGGYTVQTRTTGTKRKRGVGKTTATRTRKR